MSSGMPSNALSQAIAFNIVVGWRKINLKKKLDIQTKIAQVKNEISKINNGDGHKLSDLLDRLDSLEADLNKIVDQETAGLIVRSRIRWAEHGERSSKYFLQSWETFQWKEKYSHS